jgi:hypothetical protein
MLCVLLVLPVLLHSCAWLALARRMCICSAQTTDLAAQRELKDCIALSSSPAHTQMERCLWASTHPVTDTGHLDTVCAARSALPT